MVLLGGVRLMPKTYTPFVLSLSKPVLSGCRRRAAEGGSLRKLCFDKLSTNGVGEVKHAR